MDFQDKRYMIEKASQLASDGEEVFLEFEQIGSLNVQECSIVNEQSNLARVKCWSAGDRPSETLIVQLAKVLAVRIKGNQALAD